MGVADARLKSFWTRNWTDYFSPFGFKSYSNHSHHYYSFFYLISTWWQSLGVESQVHPAPTTMNLSNEQEPLILNTSSADLSPNSPLQVPKRYPSQRSISPSAFSFSIAVESSVIIIIDWLRGCDNDLYHSAQQTDQGTAAKIDVADESRDMTDREEESSLTAGVSPSNPTVRIHLDSVKAEDGLEAIAEQTESTNSPTATTLE